MNGALVAACAVSGLVVGPALVGPIARLPIDDRAQRGSWLTARCSQCGATDARLLVPMTRPPCRGCGHQPSWRAWLVPLVTATLFAAMAGRIGSRLALIPFLFFAAVLVVVAFIDIEHLRIPDRVTFPSLAVSAALIVAVSISDGHPHWIVDALIGAFAFFAILLVFHLLSPAGMGFGDVKLGLLLGLYLGWISPRLVIWGLLLGALLGTVIGVAVGVARRSRKAAFPFGPALGLGTMLAVVFAPRLLN